MSNRCTEYSYTATMPTNSAVSTLAASPPNPDMISHRPRDSALVSHESTGYASANENDEDNNSDLGEVVSADDYNARTQSSAASSQATESDDSDMARKIEAAREDESLIGSDDSGDDTYLFNEEQYMIEDETKRQNNTVRKDVNKNSTAQPDVFENEDDFWDSFAKTDGWTDDDDIVTNELFKPQRGFASTPEPLFSDFYGSSDETDRPGSHEDGDDEDALTTDEDITSLDDGSSTISDVESLSVPLIAHVGAAQDMDGHTSQQDMTNKEELGEKALKNAIPLLVIEDLDGRLIYARAGDGEAVFGSDGEFEFEGESDEQSSDDEMFLGDSAKVGIRSHAHEPPASEFDASGADDGDTTDELPDSDMPYPRLLVGSIAPRGGRNARRAREIAARSRHSSPRVSSPAPRSSAVCNTPLRNGPSSLSNSLSLHNESIDQGVDPSQTSEDEGSSEKAAAHVSLSKESQPTLSEPPKPVMGQFMPAYSKSIHRAVIDGSHRTPSPFSTLHNMQRGLRQKRSRQQSNHESLDHAQNNGPLSLRKRKHRDISDSSLFKSVQPRLEQSNDGLDSSPEAQPQRPTNIMDIGDVLDEGLLYPGSSDDSSIDDSTSKSRQEPRRSKSSQNGTYDRAIARWTRIPMGAFRSAQENGTPSSVPPISNAYLTHQRPGGTFLLTQALRDPRQALGSSRSPANGISHYGRTPFRRSVSMLDDPGSPSASPLHRTLADHVISDPANRPDKGRHEKYRLQRLSNKFGEHAVVGGKFLISPVLRPVKHRERNKSSNNADATSPISALGDTAPSDHGYHTSSTPRKVTKREKRERMARREASKRHDTASPQPHDTALHMA